MSTQTKAITPDNLNAVMEFDHVIEVHADGTVSDAPAGIYAPEGVYDYLDDDGGSHDQLDALGDRWELFTAGYSGQYSYNGPVMHESEYIGGRLARDILAQSGYYVALTVTGIHGDDCTCDETEFHGDDSDSDIYGWAVAYRPINVLTGV